MSYLIFNKNTDNYFGSLYNIAENENDLNLLNIIKSDYKILTVDLNDFNQIKINLKKPIKYENDLITYENINSSFLKENLILYIEYVTKRLNNFLINNKNHPSFIKFNDYLSQLNAFDFDSISYPLLKSFENHLLDTGQTYYHPLQIP